MTSIKQLRGDLTTSGDQPSTKLKTYFKVCLVFTFWSTSPCIISSAEFWPLSLCSVIRIALWTRRRTSWSAWRPSERRSAWGLARRSAPTLSNSADRYSLMLFKWRVTMIQSHIVTPDVTHMSVTCLSEVQSCSQALLQSHGGDVGNGMCGAVHRHLKTYWNEISTNSSLDCNKFTFTF